MVLTIAHQRGPRLSTCAVAFAVTFVPSLHADPALLGSPIASRNLSPIYANLGVPVMQDARGLPPGSWELGWQLHWASHSVRETGVDGLLEFDGETQRHDLKLAVGLGAGFDMNLTVPWIRHDGGALDSLIDDWHAFWGLPDGPRPRQGQDQLRYFSSSGPGFLLDEGASGFGDAELDLAWRFGIIDGAQISAFAHGKFATGDAQDFTGSGSNGASVGLRASAGECVSVRVSCHMQLGVAYVGEIDLVPGADDAIWFGGVSVSWLLTDSLAITGQIDAQASPFDGVLNESGDPIWGALGVRYSPGDAWRFDFQFSEDLAVGSAPDITFLLSASRRFR
ncbi:MAG: DUF3187 family protein [Pseudomonadota bacterium]